jgi:hypothetical protein
VLYLNSLSIRHDYVSRQGLDPSTSVFELFMSFRQEEVFFETIYTVSGSPTFSNAPSWASIPMMMVSSVTSRLYGSSGVPKL